MSPHSPLTSRRLPRGGKVIKTVLAVTVAAGLTVVCGCGQSAPAAPAAPASGHPAPASGHSAPASALRAGTSTAAPARASCLRQAPPTCYLPRIFDTAYGIQPLLDRGIDGRGVTVVLPEEAQTGPTQSAAVTDIRQDVADLDSRFGLPPARVQVITTLAGPSASPWLANLEEVEDTELVHAVAPDATIVELLVNPADVNTEAKAAAMFATIVRIAVRHGQVISWSFGGGLQLNGCEDSFTHAEVATDNSALEYAAARHVTFVTGSGDKGAACSAMPVKGVEMPSSDPLVLAVGGTSMTANPASGAYISETAWNTPPSPKGDQSSASGGGFSHLFARPAYQDGVPGVGAMRGVPDVAADASPSTGMALARTTPGGGYRLTPAQGTSAGGPFWAGLIALADQEAGHSLGFVNPAIYRIARGPLYHKAFHDIATGNNTVTDNGVTITGYQAGPGWDPVTGWGTPDARVLIPLLAR